MGGGVFFRVACALSISVCVYMYYSCVCVRDINECTWVPFVSGRSQWSDVIYCYMSPSSSPFPLSSPQRTPNTRFPTPPAESSFALSSPSHPSHVAFSLHFPGSSLAPLHPHFLNPWRPVSRNNFRFYLVVHSIKLRSFTVFWSMSPNGGEKSLFFRSLGGPNFLVPFSNPF